MTSPFRESKLVFVFSAGRLNNVDRRLCDLQKEYVERRGFQAIVPPIDHPNIWGTLAELRYFASMLQLLRSDFPSASAEVFTADYHRGRAKALGERKAGLEDVRFVAVNTRNSPPSLRARVHEWLGYAEVVLPDHIFATLKACRREALRRGWVHY